MWHELYIQSQRKKPHKCSEYTHHSFQNKLLLRTGCQQCHVCIEVTTQDFERHSAIGKIRSQRSFRFLQYLFFWLHLWAPSVGADCWLNRTKICVGDRFTDPRTLASAAAAAARAAPSAVTQTSASSSGRNCNGKRGLQYIHHHRTRVNGRKSKLNCHKWSSLSSRMQMKNPGKWADFNWTLHWTWAQCLSEMFYRSLAVMKSKATREWTWAALGGQSQPLASVKSWCLPVKYDG